MYLRSLFEVHDDEAVSLAKASLDVGHPYPAIQCVTQFPSSLDLSLPVTMNLHTIDQALHHHRQNLASKAFNLLIKSS